MTLSLASCWLTAAEIAERCLPGLPTDKRAVNAMASASGWARQTGEDGTPLARRRAARGGGTEYHASLFPETAQEFLSGQVPPLAANDTCDAEVAAWAWFEGQPTTTKAKAEHRMAILMEVEARVATGSLRTSAIELVAKRHAASPRTIAGWFKLVSGARRSNWLPRLAPQHKGGGKEVEIDAEAWQILKSDYLRNERPAFRACYNRLLEDYARPRGITLPSPKTLERRLKREAPSSVIIAKREGKEALRRMIPPQLRTVADIAAMQAVNLDGHMFDVFVQWEDGRIGRPIMVGIQDVRSRKLLSHRIGETENTRLARLTFADLFRDWGIPQVAVMDNGRAFASRALTGGTKTRFRFKIMENEATGILTALGIETRSTLPYRGSSKPIERAWRDLCEDIAKHPAVSGAYTGNKPDAKPENYRDRAIPIAEFREHVDRRIAAHNARSDRRTEMARGGSFDDAFAASYSASAVGQASETHLRLALLEAQECRCHRDHGSVTLMGNRYWAPELHETMGQKVIVRFNPDDLHSDVHIYRPNGQYLCAAPIQVATGFLDQEGAKTRAKLEAAHRKATKAAAQALDLLEAAKVAELLSGHSEPPAKPAPGAARMVRHRGQVAAALKPIEQAVSEPAAPSFIDNFAAGAARLRAVE